MHHNMRDGCTTRQDGHGVFPEEALLEIMDGYVEIVTMLFERFCGIRGGQLRERREAHTDDRCV
jgi:hypothetical protein